MRIMRPAGLAAFGALLLVTTSGCPSGGYGTDGGGGGGSDAGDLPGTDASQSTTFLVAGDITADALWTDSVTLTGDATILAGVTVTIAAGTAFYGAAGAGLRIEGTLIVDGTDAANVTMQADAGAATWVGLEVAPGGNLAMAYADVTTTDTVVMCDYGALACDIDHSHFHEVTRALDYSGPGAVTYSIFENFTNDADVYVRAGGDLTLTDSIMRSTTHDMIVMTAGSLAVDHCEIGSAGNSAASGTYEHCLYHVSADALTITNSTFLDGLYGMMIGNTNGAVINYNNFIDNDTDMDNLGGNSNIDLRFNYWSAGVPTLPAAFDTSGASGTMVTGAGPRP
jgi:hypothetical protein